MSDATMPPNTLKRLQGLARIRPGSSTFHLRRCETSTDTHRSTPSTGEENPFQPCGPCNAHTRLVPVLSFTWLSKPRWTRLCVACFSGALTKRPSERLTITETEPLSWALAYPPPPKTCGCTEEFFSLIRETELNGHKVQFCAFRPWLRVQREFSKRLDGMTAACGKGVVLLSMSETIRWQ